MYPFVLLLTRDLIERWIMCSNQSRRRTTVNAKSENRKSTIYPNRSLQFIDNKIKNGVGVMTWRLKNKSLFLLRILLIKHVCNKEEGSFKRMLRPLIRRGTTRHRSAYGSVFDSVDRKCKWQWKIWHLLALHI